MSYTFGGSRGGLDEWWQPGSQVRRQGQFGMTTSGRGRLLAHSCNLPAALARMGLCSADKSLSCTSDRRTKRDWAALSTGK